VKPRDIYLRTLLRVGGHDGPISLVAIAVWVWLLKVIDWRVLVPLMIVRIVVWVMHARAVLEPVRAWQRRGDKTLDDRELLEVDAALQRLRTSFLRGYAGGWLVTLALAFAFGALGVPSELPSGSAERAVGVLLLGLVGVAEFVTVRPLLAVALLDTQTELAGALAARGIRPQRPPRSLATSIHSAFFGLSGTIIVVISSIAGMLHVRERRAQALDDQLARARLGALLLRHDETEALEPDLVVHTRTELPAILEPRDEELLGAIEPSAGRVLAAAPVGDGRWVLAAAKPDEQVGLLLAVPLGLLLAFTPALLLVSRPLSRTLLDPLEALDESTRQMIDAGEVRSLERIVALENDEIGRLAGNFNRMLDMLKELVVTASAVAEGDIQVEIERPGELHDAFRGMLTRLREVVTQIRLTTLELASAAAEIHAATLEQERAADQQSTRMEEINETAGSLAASAGSITRATADVLDDAEQAANNTDEVATKIAELDEQTRGIGELLELIREIADRSDLLALNGSLEATRAGEAGRGFALVAAEMRRLAERVNATVDDVRLRVGDIERAGTLTVSATEHSRALAQSTAEAARKINEVMRRQSKDSKQVSAAVREAAAGVAAGAIATSQTRASAEGLKRQAEELEALTRQFNIGDDDEV
jgi:methyl-accepting chemotaxis protein